MTDRELTAAHRSSARRDRRQMGAGREHAIAEQDVIIIGAGIGGLHSGARPAPGRHAVSHLRSGRRDQAARRRPQPAAARGQRAVASSALQNSCSPTRASKRSEYCFYTRHGQLVYREPRGRSRRLRLAADLDPSRRSARSAAPARCANGCGADAIALGHQLRRRSSRTASGAIVRFVDATAARRCRTVRRRRRDRLRRRAFGRARADAPEGSGAALRGHHAISRHDALEAVPHRREHGLSSAPTKPAS